MRRLRILVADDSPEVRLLIQAVLTGEAHEVHAVADGAQALELLRRTGGGLDAVSQPFDLLITDRLMPSMGGEALLRQLRQLGIRIPAIVVTGVGDASGGDEPTWPGVAAVLRKPFLRADLLAAVSRAVGDR